MSDWQTANEIIWYINLYWAIWDSAVAQWDDQVVVWDAIGDHGWQVPAVGTWYTKN